MQDKKLTKKERRLLRTQGITVNNVMDLKHVNPMTMNQKKAFESFKKNKNLMLHGTAGTGKTFVGLYLALKEVLQNEQQDKVIIVRSVVPSRDIGFLPGNHKEKIKVYESPYYLICTELFNRGDAYDILKQKNQIEFISTSFIRGITIKNCIVVLDEIQNMNWGEISTVLTRIGENCRVVICGDTKQSDLSEKDGKRDLLKLLNICRNMNTFEFIQMTKNDIVRSGFVKEFIIECENLGY
jgi:phosphate starvation-inducible protein PhoH